MTDAAPRIKITYATLRADNEQLHSQFEAALARVQRGLGGSHRNVIAGKERDGATQSELRPSPIDRDLVVGRFADGTRQDVQDAIAAARAAQPAWAALGWEGRLEILRRAAELISDRLLEISALMAIEVGKNRIEALGETEEAADLIRYYAQTAVDNDFYEKPMDNLGDTATGLPNRVLRPHGVFAVISPFQLPDGPLHRPCGGRDDGR